MTDTGGVEKSRGILIVDDDDMGAQLLITLLEMEGYQAFQPEDWANPVSDIEQRRPFLVLVDVRLRNRSGFEVLNEIRAHRDPGVAGMPVIMMSAEDHRKRSGRAGANDFVLKPFNLTGLLNIIRKMEGG